MVSSSSPGGEFSSCRFSTLILLSKSYRCWTITPTILLTGGGVTSWAEGGLF